MKDASGINIGMVRELSWTPYVPKYGLFNSTGDVQTHVLHQPTCYGGFFVNCCAEGFCNCRVPFYIYEANNDREGAQVGSITKVWAGATKELLSDANTFEVTFPKVSDGNTKANVIGACF